MACSVKTLMALLHAAAAAAAAAGQAQTLSEPLKHFPNIHLATSKRRAADDARKKAVDRC
jgi:hypothetical protein